MSVLSCADTIEVFKFAETGIAALCEEVTYYLAPNCPYPYLKDADLSTGRYENRDGDHYIIFDRKDK